MSTATSIDGFRSTAARSGGFVHAGSWIAGLVVAGNATPAAGDSAGEIATAYADHPGQALALTVLAHGVAAAGLAAVAYGLLGWAAGRAGTPAGRAGRLGGRFGLGAAALAVLQLVLELVAIPGADPADPDPTGTLFDLVQRIDGVKMFALAAMAVATCLAAGKAPLLRRWELAAGWATAAAIATSGIGYVLLSTALTPAAYVSLPLLLIWVAALGVALHRR